jgi:hypothetical protein
MAITYEPIATATASGSASSVSFSSISSAYTDLVIVCSYKLASTGQTLNLQFNSDTSTNYSNTTLYGDGSSAASSRTTSANYLFAAYYGSDQSNAIVNVMNYANTTTYKSVVSRDNTNTYVLTRAGLWRSTAAISTVTLTSSSGNITSGSTFTLYGIKAA